MKDKCVLVIRERDLSDNEIMVLGVASNRENALKIIEIYYGKDAVYSSFVDIRDSNIDFYMSVHVPGDHGGDYRITTEDYLIDDMS